MEAISRAVANNVERNSASTVTRNSAIDETLAKERARVPDDEPQSPSCDVKKCLGRALLFRCCSSKATRDEGSQQWENQKDWSPGVSEFDRENVPSQLHPFSPTFVRSSMISELPRLRGREIELPRVWHEAVDDASIAEGRYDWGEYVR